MLESAAALFYRDGIAATGMASLAYELRASKATIYTEFGNKEELVAAALRHHDGPTLAYFVESAAALAADPSEQLVALFAVLAETVDRVDYRGCRFLNAAAELADPGHPARAVISDHKRSLGAWFERTARLGGLARPRALAAQLLMLFDGALAGGVAVEIRSADLVDAAQILVDAHRA